MSLQQVFYNGLPDHHDNDYEAESKSHMVVEWVRAWKSKNAKIDDKVQLIKCYIPADVWRRKDGTVVVCYEHHPNGSYDPYLVKALYDENNMPNVYRFTSIGVKECLLLSIGVLLGYDELEDCFRPFVDHVDEKGEYVYEMWYDIPMLKDNWKIWTEV